MFILLPIWTNVTEAKTLQKNGWHQHSNIKGKRPHLLPAPKIIATYPTLLVWKWHHKNPYRWNAYLSLDGGATYQFDDFVYGNARQYAPDGGTSLMYIVGVDAHGNEITKRSNAVRADDIMQKDSNIRSRLLRRKTLGL